MLLIAYPLYPFVAGRLWDLLRNQTVALEGETLLPLLRGVAVGMAFLHAHEPPIVHADLKSSKILVSCWFQAKVRGSDTPTSISQFIYVLHILAHAFMKFHH